MSEELFIEWTSSTYHTALMIPKNMEMGKGFRSCYCFDAQQKAIIEAQGSMSGIEQMAVYSDTLFIDIDNDEDAMLQCADVLTIQKTAYELYESGGKGYHFHIPLDQTYQHVNLPAIQKQCVKSMGIPVDESIYRHAGLFRLPGQKHIKTGKKKRLIEKRSGDLLNLDMSVEIYERPKRLRTSLSTSAEALNECLYLMINSPAEGGRYMKLWKMAKMLQEAQFTEEFAMELLVEVNCSWDSPKPIEEITRAIREVYRK